MRAPPLSSEYRRSLVRRILEALVDSEGNVKKAAHLVGMSRRHLYRWLHNEGLCPALNKIRRDKAEKAARRTSLDRLISEVDNGSI
jgi:AraC-like DNA-binding protein